MKSAPSIAFDHRPSPAIAAFSLALVVAAAIVPWLSALPLVAKIAVSVLVLVYGIAAILGFVRTRFRRVAYRAAGWVLVDETGTEHAAILASHVRFGVWISLDFRLDGRRCTRALIGPGTADAETRRRLILLLSRAEVVQAA